MLHYTQQGRGPALVLLHGFCETNAVWQNITHILAAQFQVTCIDLPGFGHSPALPDDADIDYFAQAVAQTLQQAQVQRPVVVGHSLGGYVVLALAAQNYPMAGIGLFYSTALPDTEEKKEMRLKTVDFIQRHSVKDFVQGMFPSLFAPDFVKANPELVQQIIADAAQTPADTVVKTTLAMRNRPDRTALLAQLSVPVLFVAGKQDAAVPFETLLPQLGLPHVAVAHVLGHVGHMGMFESPSENIRHLTDFTLLCHALY